MLELEMLERQDLYIKNINVTSISTTRYQYKVGWLSVFGLHLVR